MCKVICIGELLIDFVCTDTNKSLSNGENFKKKAGGAPANVAVAIQKMGANAYMLGSVGKDQFGDFLEETLKCYDVNTDYLVKSKLHPTTLAFVSLNSDGERDFRFNRGADGAYSYDMINQEILKEAKIFHFGSATAFLGGELKDTYYKMLDFAVQHNKMISFDPNFRDALFGQNTSDFINHSMDFIKHSDILKVSEEEAMLLTGESDVEKAAFELNRNGARYVMITLGNKGTLLSTQERQEYVPVIPVKMIDATGAGDAFIGTVIAKVALNGDLSFEKMIYNVKLANIAGSLTVQKYGALDSIPYWNELEK